MKSLLRQLIQSALVVIPFISNVFTTEYGECDGFIKYDEDRYAFCSAYSRYEPEDSVEFHFYSPIIYYIDLPGKVIDYQLQDSRPMIIFEDGSVMIIHAGYLGDTFNNIVVGDEAVELLDKSNVIDYLEDRILKNDLDNIMDFGCDPSEWIEPYCAHYRMVKYRDNLVEEVLNRDYDRLNFNVSLPAFDFMCLNVPKDSMLKFFKSIGSLQILNKNKHYDHSRDHKIFHFNSK